MPHLSVNHLQMTWRVPLLLMLAWWSLSTPTFADIELDGVPQKITDAERFAVELVARAIHEGPESWWPLLAEEAPLRQLDRPLAEAELAVRLGRFEGSRWTLVTPGPSAGEHTALFQVDFPSGIDDQIELTLVPDGDGFRLLRVMSWADGRTVRASFETWIEAGGSAEPFPSEPADRPGPAWPALLILLFLLLLLGSRRRSILRPIPAMLVAGLAVSACDHLPTSEPSEPTDTGILVEVAQDFLLPLAELKPLRDRLTTEPNLHRAEIIQHLSALTAEDPLFEVTGAWITQYLIAHGDPEEAGRILETLPSPSTLPVTEVQRARLAALQHRHDEVEDLYEVALRVAPSQDLLRLEAAAAILWSGDEDLAESHFASIAKAGSRFAEAYYFAYRFATVAKNRDDASPLFLTAWELTPISRRELFADPLLSDALTFPDIFPLFDLSSVAEPIRPPAARGRRALEGSGGAKAELLGRQLTFTWGEDTETEFKATALVVPAGEELAPADTVVESAASASRRTLEKALSRLPQLYEDAQYRERLLIPARQRLVETAAGDLARSFRWKDILRLTDSMGIDAKGFSPALVRLRAQALMNTEDISQAQALVLDLATDELSRKRRDPATYYQLAELFAAGGQYELAESLIKKADQVSPFSFGSRRLKQIDIDRSLNDSYIVRETDHFRLHYPPETGRKYPRHLGWVLEAEWRRLSRWIPVRLEGGKKIDVQLVPFRTFMDAYSSGVMVVGIYDGKVRVPLADVQSLDPVIVGIVSHEIAHAMIDHATDGKAPKWLHEGLAGHVEMWQPGINPVPEMHKVDRDLSFAVINPALSGFSQPDLVDLAYGHAAWVFHYIESKYGEAKIHQLLRAFRQGLETPRAIRKTFGRSLEQFDREWRQWCLDEAPSTWSTELVRYDRAFDNILSLAGEDGLSEAEVAALIDRGNLVRSSDRRSQQAADRSRQAEDKKEKQLRLVKDWHRHYMARAVPVKAQLKTTMGLIKNKNDPQKRTQACQLLASKIYQLQKHPKALDVPVPGARKPLGQVYEHFLGLSMACRDGQLERVKLELDQAKQALRKAHRELAPFGVKP